MPEQGRLILVVGPSGSGKDTLLDGARLAFCGHDKLRFARREITRQADAGGEEHSPVTFEEFAERESSGFYALAWRAHGLAYGITHQEISGLGNGVHVVVNTSRTVTDQALLLDPHACVISIRLPTDTLRTRLVNRGRERGEDIEERIERAEAFNVVGDHVIELWNDDTPERGREAFVSIISELTGLSPLKR